MLHILKHIAITASFVGCIVCVVMAFFQLFNDFRWLISICKISQCFSSTAVPKGDIKSQGFRMLTNQFKGNLYTTDAGGCSTLEKVKMIIRLLQMFSVWTQFGLGTLIQNNRIRTSVWLLVAKVAISKTIHGITVMFWLVRCPPELCWGDKLTNSSHKIMA